MDRRQFTQSLLGTFAISNSTKLMAQSGIKSASGYPDKPIKLVVPYPAGGVVDVVVRAVTDSLSNELAQRIVVENRTGADGRIGLDFVAKSPADGYTLLAATPLLAVGEHLMPEMKGRVNDFVGLCAFAAAPSVFVVHADVPATSMKEFVALAQSKPGVFNAANPGTGSSIHLAQELFFEQTGIKLINVNYKGQPPSLLDLGQGSVHFGLVSQNLALPLIQTGRVRPLAVNAGARTRALPNVPTVTEIGLADILVRSWYGTAAHIATPKPIIQFLSDQFSNVMTSPNVKAKLESMDCEILALNNTQFDALIQSEFKRWGNLIRARKIQM